MKTLNVVIVFQLYNDDGGKSLKERWLCQVVNASDFLILQFLVRPKFELDHRQFITPVSLRIKLSPHCLVPVDCRNRFGIQILCLSQNKSKFVYTLDLRERLKKSLRNISIMCAHYFNILLKFEFWFIVYVRNRFKKEIWYMKTWWF